jgi:hypothetical protein
MVDEEASDLTIPEPDIAGHPATGGFPQGKSSG